MGFNSFSNECILKALLIIVTIFLLLFFTADFFTVYYDLNTSKFVFLDARRAFLEKNILFTFASTIGFLMVCYITLKLTYWKSFCSEYKFLFYFVSCFIIYYFIVGAKIRGMFFFGVLCTFFLYGVLPFLFKHNHVNYRFLAIKKLVVYICVLYVLIPLAIYFIHYGLTLEKYFQFDFSPQLYIVDGFRGMTLDRVQYGFLCSIIALVVFLEKDNLLTPYLIIFCLLVGSYLAMARAPILGFLFAIVFLYYEPILKSIKSIKSIKKTLFSIAFFLLLLILLSILSGRKDLFFDGGNRILLLTNSFEKIFQYGWKSFLFGHENYYIVNSIKEGQQPHNSILQTVMNFGVIITFLWLLILYKYFMSLNINGKAIFIFTFTFGLFHAGFSAFLFMPITVFSYILILFFNESYNCKDKRNTDDCSIA